MAGSKAVILRLVYALLLAALTGCASVPDPNDCRAYGVEPNQPHFPGCDTITEYSLDKQAVFAACHSWGCARFRPDGKGQWNCEVRYYKRDAYVRNHELCHARHGPRHINAMTLDELMDALREWFRNGQVN